MADVSGNDLQTLITVLNNLVVGQGGINKAITNGLSSIFVQTTGAVTTSATAGSHGDVPAQVDGYITINIPSVGLRKVPYYLP